VARNSWNFSGYVTSDCVRPRQLRGDDCAMRRWCLSDPGGLAAGSGGGCHQPSADRPSMDHGDHGGGGAASVASFEAAVLTEIYLCNVCSCQETLRRNGPGQGAGAAAAAEEQRARSARDRGITSAGGHGYQLPAGASLASSGLDNNCNLGGGSVGGDRAARVGALTHLLAVQLRLGE
jgi:hypothetical protein